MSGELALVKKEAQAVMVVPDSVISDYLNSFGNKLSDKHRNQFIQIARAFNLNPFIREIYGIPYGDNFSIIVGYEVYLKRAENSGQLAGWKAWTDGEGASLKGCVEITRKDWEKPFYHEVYLEEYDQKNSMWKSKPRTMIKKVAIAQGFRMAFPVELGGMPYTADELPKIETDNESVPALASKPHVDPPKEKEKPKDDNGKKVSEAQAKMIFAKCKNKGLDHKAVCAHYGVEKIQDLPASEVNGALKLIDSGEIAAAPQENPKEKPLPEICAECGKEYKDGACRTDSCPEAKPYED